MITIRKPDGNAFLINAEILSFKDRPSGSKVTDLSFNPYTIRRLPDGEVFSLGDRVSNDTSMCGIIIQFGLLDDQVWVKTTYSGVGMNLDSLSKVPTTPSRFQQGDAVAIKFQAITVPKAVVRQVHFTLGKVKYDLEVWMDKGTSTRIYNIDELILEEV